MNKEHENLIKAGFKEIDFYNIFKLPVFKKRGMYIAKMNFTTMCEDEFYHLLFNFGQFYNNAKMTTELVKNYDSFTDFIYKIEKRFVNQARKLMENENRKL